MLTEQDKMWFRIYESQSEESQKIIDDAFSEVKKFMEDQMSMKLPQNDHAEALVAAITRYFVAGDELAVGGGEAIVDDIVEKIGRA